MVDVEGVAGSALNIFVLVFLMLAIGGVCIFVTWLILKELKYKQFRIVIWQKVGFNQFIEKKDRGGIFIDNKTKNKRFFLKKHKVGLNPDVIPYIISGKEKVVYLLQVGLKNFFPINISAWDTGNVKFTVGEEDVNWAVNDYERQKKLFQQSVLLQYMPFILIAFVSIVILIIFIYFFKEFPVLAKAAEELKIAAQEIARAKSGTTIIE